MVPANSFHTAELSPEVLAQFGPGQLPQDSVQRSLSAILRASHLGREGSWPEPAVHEELSFGQEATPELNTGKQRNTASQSKPRGAKEIPLQMRLEPCVYPSPTGSAKLFWPIFSEGISPQLWT